MKSIPLVVPLVTLVMLFASFLPCTHGCSCLLSHPQTQYCQADFVILATIKRVNSFSKDIKTYKIRIRKEYKMSEKAKVALKSGKLTTSYWDSMCGANLNIGQTYVLSGRINSLKAVVTLCDLQMLWRDLTSRQRKGFKMMYKHGCTCQVQDCRRRKHCVDRNHETCWTMSNCHVEHGICLRSKSNKCTWTRNKALASCIKQEWPLTISRWSG